MDLFDWFFKQPVTEGEMDEAFDNAQQADQDLMANQGLIGVMVNGDVAEHFAVPDLTVDIAAPVLAYDQTGQRIFIPGTAGVEVVDVSVDSNSVSTAVAGGGNEKIVSVFIQFARALSNPRIDGNSATVDFNVDESFAIIVEQGAEAAPPATPPALKVDALLLGDITRTFGQTQIFDADIDLSRKESTFKLTTATFSIDAGTQEEALQDILQEFQNHVDDLGAAHDADAVAFDPLNLPIPASWSATLAATNVQDAIDGIVDDLTQFTATSGAGQIGFDPSTSDFVNATVQQVLANEVGPLAGTNAWTGQNDFDDLHVTSENSITDDAADTDAAREAPLIDAPTVEVTTNNDKRLIYQIEESSGRFHRLYVSGNGWNFTFNARWDHATSTWLRDAGTASSYRWRFGTVSVPFEYEERTNGEADGWTDTGWVIAGRQLTTLIGSGDQLSIEDGGIEAPGTVDDLINCRSGRNESAGGLVERVQSNFPIFFPAVPTSAVVNVLVATNLSVNPLVAAGDFFTSGINVTSTVSNGPLAYSWEAEFDVS